MARGVPQVRQGESSSAAVSIWNGHIALDRRRLSLLWGFSSEVKTQMYGAEQSVIR